MEHWLLLTDKHQHFSGLLSKFISHLLFLLSGWFSSKQCLGLPGFFHVATPPSSSCRCPDHTERERTWQITRGRLSWTWPEMAPITAPHISLARTQSRGHIWEVGECNLAMGPGRNRNHFKDQRTFSTTIYNLIFLALKKKAKVGKHLNFCMFICDLNNGTLKMIHYFYFFFFFPFPYFLFLFLC